MFKKILFPIMLLMVVARTADAENWVGQAGPPAVNGTIGPYVGPTMATSTIGIDCVPGNTPLPCGAGQTSEYNGASGPWIGVPSVPSGAGPGSGLYVWADGPFQDPSSPSGLSAFDGPIPLADFATSSSVDALGASFNALSTQMQSLSTAFAQVQQQLVMQDKSLRQGVAMSLAMDGTGTLGPDEHFAMSMNWGTFGGQNGVAGSIAFRAADHVTFDGGIGTGLHGGLIGGRAGVRIAW